MSRTTNAFRNAGTVIAGQLLNNVLRFVCRTAFIHTLGMEFLGISSLYSNVLTILSISELGFSTAITYSLYEPLAKNDRDSIRSLMGFYKTAYRVIGLVILGLGLALMPFLPWLMNGVTDRVNIYHYYLLYLAQTVVSYLFFAFKAAILNADQKKYLADYIHFFCQMVTTILQIVVLFVWQSFLGYTVLGILSGILQNLLTAVLVDRRYPYLKAPAKPLPSQTKKDLFSRVYALALQKISTAIGTATDNLIISSFVSVVAVGVYDNYHMVVSIVQNLLGGVFRALTASLGNLMVTESKARSEFVFRSLNLANSFLVSLCSVCFLALFQPFVLLWAGGEEYLLSFPVVVIVVLNFATNYQQNVVLIYRSAGGLFVYGKYRSVANAVLNLGISLVLVQIWGIAGVFLGSIISRLVTTWWYDAWILYKKGFAMKPWRYYLESGLTLVLTGLCYGLVCLICVKLPGNTWPTLILRGITCVAVTAAVFGILYGRTKEFRYLWSRAMAVLGRGK